MAFHQRAAKCTANVLAPARSVNLDACVPRRACSPSANYSAVLTRIPNPIIEPLNSRSLRVCIALDWDEKEIIILESRN